MRLMKINKTYVCLQVTCDLIIFNLASSQCPISNAQLNKKIGTRDNFLTFALFAIAWVRPLVQIPHDRSKTNRAKIAPPQLKFHGYRFQSLKRFKFRMICTCSPKKSETKQFPKEIRTLYRRQDPINAVR